MADAFEQSGTSTYCSANFVKPPQCRRDHWATGGDRVPHYKLPSGRVGFPLRSVHGGTVEFVHNYKAAGTALRNYFVCEYGEDSDTTFSVSAFAVRDPIDRFISSVGEVLQRVVNGVCPDGPCPGIPKSNMLRSTAWYPLVNRSNFTLTTMIPELVAAFVDDIACCHEFYARDHFAPQSTFATFAEKGIDTVIRLDNVEEGLDEVARSAGLASRRCKLELRNSATSKPSNLPSTAQLRGALSDTLVRKLCQIYDQDFTCFGLKRPAACAATDAPDKIAHDWRSEAEAPAETPLVSAMILTCNRPGFAAMALGLVRRQTFPIEDMEAVLVDDGPLPVGVGLIAAMSNANVRLVEIEVTRGMGWRLGKTPKPARDCVAPCLEVTLVRISHRRSIGAKRNLAVKFARGQVILHFDDDDLHHPDRIGLQAGPILREEASLSTLGYSWGVHVRKDGVSWFKVSGRKLVVPSMSTLAYRRSLALQHPFADVSIAEDIHFAESAMATCETHVLRTLPSVYTRHVHNTWNWTSNSTGLHKALAWRHSRPPTFMQAMAGQTTVEDSLMIQFKEAALDMQRHESCVVTNNFRPPQFGRVMYFPRLPGFCCGFDKREKMDSGTCDMKQPSGGGERGTARPSAPMADEDFKQAGARNPTQMVSKSGWRLTLPEQSWSRGQKTCEMCSDEPSPWMKARGRRCRAFDWGLRNRCLKDESWLQNLYCMHSCHRHGFAYPDHICCNASYAQVARESTKLMAKTREKEGARLNKFVAAG